MTRRQQLGITGALGLSLAVGALPALPVQATVSSVSIVSPAVGSHVRATVPISVHVASDTGIRSVELGVDGVGVDARSYPDGSGPGHTEFYLDTRRLTDGQHVISIRVTDSGGSSGGAGQTLVVDNTPPVIAPPRLSLDLGSLVRDVDVNTVSVPASVVVRSSEDLSDYGLELSTDGGKTWRARGLVDELAGRVPDDFGCWKAPGLPLDTPDVRTTDIVGGFPAASGQTVNNKDLVTFTGQLRLHGVDLAGNTSFSAVDSVTGFILDDTSTRVRYSQRWLSFAIPGAFGGSAHSTIRPRGTASVSAELPDCSRVGLLATRGPDRGIARIEVDDAFVVEVDLYSPVLEPSYVVPLVDDLRAGPHTVSVGLTGRKHPASTGTRVDVDGFVGLG